MDLMQYNDLDTTLHTKNAHVRDERISFIEEGHRYFIDGREGYTSTTTVVHDWFEPFDADSVIQKMMSSVRWEKSKYFGMSADEIKKQWSDKGENAAMLGTLLHERIEYFYNDWPWTDVRGKDGVENTRVEFEQFERFNELIVAKKGYVPYRTEWCVFDNDHRISGSIDMIFQVSADDPDTLMIYDWKRTAKLKKSNAFQCGKAPLEHLPDCNYWHYALQLNIYRHILETFYGKTIAGMVLVAMHPERDRFEHQPVPRLTHEVDAILEQRRAAMRAEDGEAEVADR